MLQADMRVLQHGDAEPAQFANPGIGAGIVFVVAGDEKAAMGRAALERLGMPRQFGDAAIDQIAGDRKHMRIERIDLFDDALQEGTLDRRATWMSLICAIRKPCRAGGGLAREYRSRQCVARRH